MMTRVKKENVQYVVADEELQFYIDEEFEIVENDVVENVIVENNDKKSTK